MRRTIALSLVVASFLLFGLTALAQPSDSVPAAVGRVTDPRGRPVPDAMVELIQFRRGTVAEQTTTSVGTFSFELANVQPEPVLIRVWAKGYKLAESTWFAPRPGGRFDLTAIPVTTSVEGWVEDLWGQPVAEARVDYLSQAGEVAATALTDKSGSFLLVPDRPVDGGTLRVLARGYQPYQQAVISSENPVVARLSPTTGIVTGQVLDARGQTPISKARILVQGPDRTLFWEGVTESDGRFTVSLPQAENEYRVVVWYPGYEAGVQSFTLGDGERQVLLPLVLQRSTAGVSGRVRGPFGDNPKVGVSVHLDLHGVGTVAVTTTDANGEYSFADIRVGQRYRVLAVVDQKPVASNWFEPKSDQHVTWDIRTPDTAPYFGIGTGVLVGRVKDSTGQPVPGAKVSARHPGQGRLFTAVTNETGEFRLDNLPATHGSEGAGPGYWVTVEKTGYMSSDQVDETDADGLVSLPMGQTVQVGMTLRTKVADLTGTVVDHRGRSVSVAKVRLIQSTDGRERTVYTDTTGTFIFKGLDALPYPSYFLVTENPGYRTADPGGQTFFQLEPGEASRRVLRLQPRNGTLTGKVLDVDGEAVTTGDVVARGSGPDHRGAIDATGSFRLELPADEGPFAVTTMGTGGWTSLGVLDAAAPVRLINPVAGRALSVPLTVHRGASTVSGTVVDRDGVPLANRRVVVFQEGTGRLAEVRTDDKGAFRFQLGHTESELRYSLRVEDAGPHPAGLERQSGLPVLFTLEGIREVSVDLEVPDAAGIEPFDRKDQ